MPTRQQIVDKARALAGKFRARADGAEQARRLPAESVQEMLAAGLARVLAPARFGGYETDLETWYDVVVEISKADASHGWCASLIIHHAHLIGQWPEACQQAIWSAGPDVAIAASFAPRTEGKRVDGGYRVSGSDSAFASGVDNSSWVMLGGFVRDKGAPEWVFFMVPPGHYRVRDVWQTAGMRGTGSNTIVTDDVFVPDSHVLSLTDLREGKGPGAGVHPHPLFRTPFFFYAPLTFVAPMLGTALGAYEHFREWMKTRRAVDGLLVAEKVNTQVRLARASADLDAAELLLRRASRTPPSIEAVTPELLARSIRDFARASELVVSAIDALITLAGTAGFASSHPIQRAWRDIHFAATHVSLNTEMNYAHFGRLELGLGRDPNRPFF